MVAAGSPERRSAAKTSVTTPNATRTVWKILRVTYDIIDARSVRRAGAPPQCATVRRVHLLVACAILLVVTSVAAADRTVVSLGTATPGGGFPLYGGAIAEAINAEDPTLDVEPRNTKGSTENVPMLAAGTLDIALVQGEVALEAPANLRILAAMYATAGMFVVRADSPYRTIEDLRGKPVAFGAQGSGLVILARYVLDGLGLGRDTDFQAIFLERAGDGPAMVLDGRV